MPYLHVLWGALHNLALAHVRRLLRLSHPDDPRPLVAALLVALAHHGGRRSPGTHHGVLRVRVLSGHGRVIDTLARPSPGVVHLPGDAGPGVEGALHGRGVVGVHAGLLGSGPHAAPDLLADHGVALVHHGVHVAKARGLLLGARLPRPHHGGARHGLLPLQQHLPDGIAAGGVNGVPRAPCAGCQRKATPRSVITIYFFVRIYFLRYFLRHFFVRIYFLTYFCDIFFCSNAEVFVDFRQNWYFYFLWIKSLKKKKMLGLITFLREMNYWL